MGRYLIRYVALPHNTEEGGVVRPDQYHATSPITLEQRQLVHNAVVMDKRMADVMELGFNTGVGRYYWTAVVEGAGT